MNDEAMSIQRNNNTKENILNMLQLPSGKQMPLKRYLIATFFLQISMIDAAQIPAGYTLVRTDNEQQGRHKYDNFSLSREITAINHYQNTANPGAPFQQTVRSEKDGPIEGHLGRTVVYAVPFRSQNILIARDQRARFDGLYQYLSDLTSDQQIPFRPLFYRPPGSNAIYHVKVTQQRWERTDHAHVDFLVVSYKSDEKLRFIDAAATAGGLVLNNHLPDPGLYLLASLDNETGAGNAVPAGRNIPRAHAGPAAPAPQATLPSWTGRREKWKHLESNATTEEKTLEIRTPHGILSIPGEGMFALTEKRAPTDGDVETLKANIESANRDIDAMLTTATRAPRGTIIIAGPTGSGKTSFINCYANNPCKSREKENGTGWELFFPANLADFAVGYGDTSKTDRPAFYIDSDNNLTLCDTAGDNDTGGMLKEILNASMTFRMFQNPAGVKLLFVVDESKINTNHHKDFIQAFDDVVESCPEDATLHQMIHLMISKHRVNNTQKFLRSLAGDPTAVPPIPPSKLLTGKTRLIECMRFLVANPDRISTFAEAPIGDEGEELTFAPDLAKARRSILSGPFIVNPEVKIKLRDECNTLIESFSRKLNEDMVKYLRTEGAQRILRYCLKTVEDHNGTVAELRKVLTDLANRLREIPSTATPEEFVSVFDGTPALVGTAATPQIFDATEMREIAANLRFLKTIRPHNVNLKVGDWKEALAGSSLYLNTIGKIEALAAEPKVTVENDTIHVKGVLVGSTDVETAMSERHITPAHIILYALNTWFIDQSMSYISAAVRTSMYAIAPRWKVTSGAKVIDLSGEAGTKGTNGPQGADGTGTVTATTGSNGSPGNPGKTAGSFFGKLYFGDNLSSLTIKAKGGKGGDGGDGGQGGAGKNASDGQEASMVVIPGTDSGGVTILPYGDTPSQYYEHSIYISVPKRYQKIGHLAPWIGSRFTDQIWVNGRVTQREHAPLGDAGQDGGQGGQKGLGGNAGDIVIHGSEDVQKVQGSEGNGANDGAVGGGGNGGTNGRVLRGTKWTECTIHGEDSPNPVDRWHVGPTHHAPAVERAAAGNSPSTPVSSADPTGPDPKVSIDQALQDSKVSEYRTYYREKSNDALLSSLLREFPGLEN